MKNRDKEEYQKMRDYLISKNAKIISEAPLYLVITAEIDNKVADYVLCQDIQKGYYIRVHFV